MSPDAIPRVAILAPFHLAALKGTIPELPVDDPSFPKGMGGYCVANLVTERWRHGLSTDVITLDPTASEPILRWDGGLTRLWVVRRRTTGGLRDGYRHEIRLLRQALQESSPDVCHAHWTYEYGLTAVSQRTYPTVVTVHDHAGNCLRRQGVQFLPHFVMARYVLWRARWITTVSPYVAKYLEGILPKPIAVVPNVLPAMAWQSGDETISPSGDGQHLAAPFLSRPLSSSKVREVRLISAVNWSRLKNVKIALAGIQAARRFWLKHDVDIRYSLMGLGMESHGTADCWARGHDCIDGVSFLGCLPYDHAIRAIKRSDLLIHPSLEESFGLPVAEAMAMGVPVIACHEAQGCRWLLGDGKFGTLVSGRSPESLAEGVNAFIRGDGDLKAKCIHARRHIRQLCDPAKVLESYDDVYRQAIRASQPGEVG